MVGGTSCYPDCKSNRDFSQNEPKCLSLCICPRGANCSTADAAIDLAQMAAKWADVFIFSASWDASANPPGKMEEEGIAFRQRLIHLVSLMHSIAMMGLRGDRNLSNLGSHHSAHKIPHFTGYLSGGPLCCPGEHK